MSGEMAVTISSGDEESAFTDVPYLIGVGCGTWHAVDRESLKFARTSDVDSVAFAVCEELVRVAFKFGAYDRSAVPVTYNPCQLCAWTVAALTGALEAEAQLLATAQADVATSAPATARIAPAATAAILAAYDAEDGDIDERSIQLLAAVAAHAPVLLMSEDCAERGCGHTEGPCPGKAACAACSLQHGQWAGEWQGTYRSECTIEAPCSVLLELAKHAGKQP